MADVEDGDATSNQAMSKTSVARDALLDWVFEREAAALHAPIMPWLAASPRFEAFLRTYQDKVRRKARLCRDDNARHDLLAELGVAWMLVQERRFAVEYERAQPERKGGPDFTAMFKTHTTLHVEAKRLRAAEGEREDGANLNKWIYAVCDKLRQLQAGDYNIIALVVEDAMSGDDVGAAMKHLKLHAERKDETYLGKRGLQVADFFAGYGRLHAIMVCGLGATVPLGRGLWLNKEARRALPVDLARVLHGFIPQR